MMAHGPLQNWRIYEASTRGEEAAWVRGLSPQERFDIYDDAFNLVWTARGELGDWERLDQWRWSQKLALRVRMLDALGNLDRVRCELAAPKNTC